MQFIFTNPDFPFSQGVVHSGRIFETVLTGIPRGEKKPVSGGVIAEMKEIFCQLDTVLTEVGLTKSSIVSVRLYLQNVNCDIAAVNEVYKEYFGSHPPNRAAYGANLQVGMLIEAEFVAEMASEATL